MLWFSPSFESLNGAKVSVFPVARSIAVNHREAVVLRPDFAVHVAALRSGHVDLRHVLVVFGGRQLKI